MKHSGKISNSHLQRLLLGLGCTITTDPNDTGTVWVVGPHKTLVAFSKNYPIRREQAVEVMKQLDVFDSFLTGLGFKINRETGKTKI